MKRTNGVTLRGNENIFDLTNRNIPLLDEDERERNERHSIICWGRIGAKAIISKYTVTKQNHTGIKKTLIDQGYRPPRRMRTN
jgi:hypothetical protein